MYNILICDDERDIVKALKIYLSAEDIRTFEAYNGLEALDIMEKEDIQLESDLSRMFLSHDVQCFSLT